MKDLRSTICIPPNWISIIVSFICAIGSLILEFCGMDAIYPHVSYWFLCILGCFAVVALWRGYEFSEKGITIWYFSILKYSVGWNHVSQLQKVSLHAKKSVLLLALKPAPACLNERAVWLFVLLHPFLMRTIEVPEGTNPDILDEIQLLWEQMRDSS